MMITLNLHPLVRQVASRHADLFNALFRSKHFAALFCLHLFGLKSLSELARVMPGSPSVSALSEAVQHFPMNRFRRRLQTRLLKRYHSQLVSGEAILVIDDTVNEKFGKSIVGTGYWNQHGKKSYLGQKIVVLALVDRKAGQAFPLSFRVCEKDPHGCQAVSTYKLALSMLDELEALGWPKGLVVMDSWFDCAHFMDDLSKRGWDFLIELKSNRYVKTNPSPFGAWKKITKSYQGLPRTGVKHTSPRSLKKGRTKYVASQRLFIKKRRSPLLVSTVFNRITGKPFAFYATNRLDLAGTELWRLSRARWHIEEAFKSLKTYFSFGKLSCHGQAGTEVSLLFSFLVLAELQEPNPAREGLTFVPSESVGTRAVKLRHMSWNASLHLMLQNPSHPLVQKLKHRRSLERIHKKPVNSTAGPHSEETMPIKSA